MCTGCCNPEVTRFKETSGKGGLVLVLQGTPVEVAGESAYNAVSNEQRKKRVMENIKKLLVIFNLLLDGPFIIVLWF
ncbi:MAG: hypothetical protein CMD96_03570 [Gammaproteobacteria bacterium]|jgi:hypothetical protein|nr:hypothetical protein [Gammaproteobacteria bacterium]|tara:strand:+ start:1277 stop:1507 length:231 start_codon:yes stop_codon:yes gene_type:complete